MIEFVRSLAIRRRKTCGPVFEKNTFNNQARRSQDKGKGNMFNGVASSAWPAAEPEGKERICLRAVVQPCKEDKVK